MQRFEIFWSSIAMMLSAYLCGIFLRVFIIEFFEIFVHTLDFKLHLGEFFIADIGWIIQACILRIFTHGGNVSFLLNHHGVPYLFEEIV